MNNMTAVHVSDVNRALLDELANLMMHRHPDLWEYRPNYNTIIGYAVSIALEAGDGRLRVASADLDRVEVSDE
jgi:hypothetical protein